MTHTGTARLFVAIELPPLVREELAAWGREVRGGLGLRARPHASIRLLESEALHLTLCFLGERPLDTIETIETAIGACARPVGELSLGAPLWLPPRRPRALAVDVHDDGAALADLHAAVHRSLAEEIERRPAAGAHGRLRAHVTVARMRPGSAPRDRRLPVTPQLSFTPVRIVLYRSLLAPAGATYEPLAACPLAPGGGAHRRARADLNSSIRTAG